MGVALSGEDPILFRENTYFVVGQYDLDASERLTATRYHLPTCNSYRSPSVNILVFIYSIEFNILSFK
jgi:hypothetical protein